MLHTEFQRQGYDLDDVVGLADQEAIDYMLRVSGFVWEKYRLIDSVVQHEWNHFSAVVLKTGVSGMLECIDRLTELSRLMYLGIPVSILDSALPKVSKLSSLRYLDISGEGNGRIQNLLLDQIQSLEAVDAKLKVDAACLPNLRHLHICDKPKGSLAKLVRSMHSLHSLTFCPYDDELAQQMEVKHLRYARLIGGSCDSISAISKFSQITNMHIQNLGRLTSIKPLLSLPNLNELSVCYCNRISDIELLAEMPSLKKLKIYACKFDRKRLTELLGDRLTELSV